MRPLAFRVRDAADRARRRWRPPRPWDGRHHPALLRFEPWQGVAEGRHLHDFLGIRTDPRFREQFRPDPPGPLVTRYPRPYAGYLELAFVLDSVVEAPRHETFVAVELGAGYGPWLVTAHRARDLLGAEAPTRLVGVEMVPHHFTWMREHLACNGIDPDRHRLIHAAISDVDGEAYFRPEPDARLDFGQALTCRVAAPQATAGARREPEGRETIRVDAIGLPRLLRETGRVDLLHADIQGEEGRAFPAAADELGRGVARLMVATHSRTIHRRLRRMLRDGGWSVVFDFRCRRWEHTPFGDVKFLDGLLAATNPLLERPANRPG